MQKTRLSDRRRSSGPRLLPLATLAAGSAVALLAMVWHDAARLKPPGNQRAIELAQNALQANGYHWARVNVRDRTLHILGRAPDDRSRVMAYTVARRALRPLMGQDSTIDTVRSHLGLNLGAERPNGNRIATGPDLDVASILPPPMPLIHDPDERTLEVASSLSEPDAKAPTPAASEATPAVDASVAEARANTQNEPQPQTQIAAAAEKASTREVKVAEVQPPVTPAPAQAVSTEPPAAEANTQVTPPAPPRKIEFYSETEHQAHSAQVVRTAAASPAPAAAIETASLDKPSAGAGAQSANACAQTFANLLSASTISFGRDSAVIERESRPLLDQLATIAKRCKAYRFIVEGHTDLTGTSAHNTALSKKRAEAVRWALIDRGVDMDHVTAEGYGASRPLERSTSDAANARNRRIAINVIEPVARK